MCAASRRRGGAFDTEPRRSARGRLPRAAPAGGGGQDLPHHHRRPHRRRSHQPRPAGRPVAGAGERCRASRSPITRACAARPWRWASARRWRVLDAPASGRLAVAEAITNILAADIDSLAQIRLSANWMAACGEPGEDAALYATVHAVGEELCPAARHRDSGRQGLAVDEDALARRRRRKERRGAGVADRLGVRAGRGRAPHAHPGARSSTSGRPRCG